MRVLFLGDVVGEPGRSALQALLPGLQEELETDAVVVNGENAAGGRGITPHLAREMLEQGVSAMTLGDHVWDQAELIPWLNGEQRVLRPFNLQAGTPGFGRCIVSTPAGELGVISLMGRTFMRPGAENPFIHGAEEAARMRAAGVLHIIVDFHAEATSEKVALGYHLDGLVSLVVGTHTHVQTADERVLPGGTAYLTDAGMCGSLNGVIGRDAAASLLGYTSGLPSKLPIGGYPARLSGVLLETEAGTGKALRVERINRLFDKV